MPQFVVCVPASAPPSSGPVCSTGPDGEVFCGAPGGSAAPVSTPPCATVGTQAYSPVMMELAAPGAVNFDNSNQLFAYTFGLILMCYLIGVGLGAIVNAVKRF